MNNTTKSIALTKTEVLHDLAGIRQDTYRVTYLSTETGESAKNVRLAFKRIGAGWFARTPYAFELWTDNSDNSGRGTYIEGGLAFDGRECVDFDGVAFAPATLVRVLRHLGLKVDDSHLANPLSLA